MGRQFRPPRRVSSGIPGVSYGGMPVTAPNVIVNSSTVIAIPNYGMTDLSNTALWTAGDFVLDAPDAGVRKVLVSAALFVLLEVVVGHPRHPRHAGQP